jgi:hypothetical protein
MIDLNFDKLNYLETTNFKHLFVLLCNIIYFVNYCVFNPILYDNTFLWRLTSVWALYYFLESTVVGPNSGIHTSQTRYM